MKKHSFLLASIVLILMFASLVINYQERYEHDSGIVVLENCVNDSSKIVNAIMTKNYLPTEEDAAFVAHHLKTVSQEGAALASLYDLNKRDWRIPAGLIDKEGSPYYRQLLDIERRDMGLDEDFYSQNPEAIKSSTTIDNDHSGSITVKVNTVSDDAGIISRLLRRDKKPCSGILVRLSEHYLDQDNVPASRILAYAKTDSDGKAVFKGLDKSLSYSVIPIRSGFEYGLSKGTTAGSLQASGDGGSLECQFIQNPHKIKIFNTATFKNIHSDHIIVVRSLQSYFMTMAIYMGIFFAAWSLFIFIYKRRNPEAGCGIISIIMIMTGICLLMMFSINDPINDKLIGVDMAQGVIAGVIVMMLLQGVNFTKFYQGMSRLPFDLPAAFIKLLCRPFGLYKKADALFERLPKGFGYMLVAVILTLLLFTPLGVAVGGMKVNLNIGILFQPSEIAKYLIVIFIAAFFCANADKIVKFSDKGNVDLFGAKMKMLGGILSGLLMLMGLYLLLGDMGPAMVLSFTFIIMYSIIKSKVDLEGLTEQDELKRILTCDLAMLIYGVLSFIAMLYIGNMVGYMWISCLAWFALWIIFGLIRKRVFESAIVFNIIIAAFIFGASIMKMFPGLDSVAERLEGRNEMCTNTWGTLPIDGQTADPGENTQVAEGLWGLASGGILGQGIGEGSPSFIPAFHTDMILSSIGEQTGFIGILMVIILMVLLLRKTVMHGYRSAHPFAFYLCLGIAVVTGVQFLIIALGSTGIIPLTGVTVPFLSFGKVSMILNLAAFGIVISIAGHNSHPSDVSVEVVKMRRAQMQKYDYSIALTSLAFTVVCIFILGVYLNYQLFQRDETLIRPVYVNNTEGYPVVNYNPRIAKMAEEMPIGNIYDRNGILLATSNAGNIVSKRGEYLSYGVDSIFFDNHIKQRLRRYYPFGEHLFYMIGDYNTRLFFTSGDLRGYLAEARHLSDLRGYDDRMSKGGEYVKVNLQSDNYKPGRYLGCDSTLIVHDLQLRDYTALLPSLKKGRPQGTNPKDIKLTLDAKLQVMLQDSLSKYARTSGLQKRYNTLRISVVVLDAIEGDLLASAVYPLPDQQGLMKLKDEELSVYRDSYRPAGWSAYSDMDLGLNYETPPGSSAKVLTSIAALQQEGRGAAANAITIYPEETIHKTGRVVEPGAQFEETIRMKEALVRSSNIYFVKLLNELDLYATLENLYDDLGCIMDEGIDRTKSIGKYQKYQEDRERRKLNDNEWDYTWGQGGLKTTPLTMARATAVVANGYLPEVKYLYGEMTRSKKILETDEVRELKGMLKAAGDISGSGITGGKTGTPERVWVDSRGTVYEHYNDGWFVFYMDGAKLDNQSSRRTTLSIAVRIERGPGSGITKAMSRSVILPLLKKLYNN